jgi:hypothetical protein
LNQNDGSKPPNKAIRTKIKYIKSNLLRYLVILQVHQPYPKQQKPKSQRQSLILQHNRGYNLHAKAEAVGHQVAES